MRAFLAIVPDKNIVNALRPALTELSLYHARDLRLVDPKKLHITLHFFENLQEQDLKPLIFLWQERMNKLETFAIHLERKLLLPTSRAANVLAYKIKKSKELMELKLLLDFELSALGYLPEHREFLPHLTIALSQKPDKLQQVEMEPLNLSFYPQEIILFESTLSAGQFQYRPIEIFPFQPSL